jgi:tetratricopeptide (TPR) repeat protein
VSIPSLWPASLGLLHAAISNREAPHLALQIADADKAASSASMAAALEYALARGEKNRAEEILSELLQRRRVEPAILLKVGVQLAERELYPEAGEVFARCVREDPTLFEAHYNLALAEFAQQRLLQALAALSDVPHRSAEEDLALSYLRGRSRARSAGAPKRSAILRLHFRELHNRSTMPWTSVFSICASGLHPG